MLQVFGDLNVDYRFKGSGRVGYSHLPGGWRADVHDSGSWILTRTS